VACSVTNTNSHIIMNKQHDFSSVQPMSVDIRLCGNIPRKELQDHFTLPGAPCILSALTSQAATLSTSCLAGANVSDNRYPTHHTTTLCDDLRGFVAHNKSNMRSALQETQPLSPLFEPPSWAVPARGETRLEVSLSSLSLVPFQSAYGSLMIFWIAGL